MTTRTKLFKIFDEITEKAFQVMKGKNNDYASNEDSFANFRSSEMLNVDPRKAVLIRMLDKIKRQVNYIENGKLSVDSAEDDVIDLINYSVMLHGLNREQENKNIYWSESKFHDEYEDWTTKFCNEEVKSCSYPNCGCEKTLEKESGNDTFEETGRSYGI